MGHNYRINTQIRAQKVRLVNQDGIQIGIVSLEEALKTAEETGLDLVEIAPQADPPVCKLMDYGKFKYQEQKKEAQARKNRAIIEVKEIRLRYNTGSGDLDTKLKMAERFLDEGNKVKFTMRFKGREVSFVDLGQKKLDEVVARLANKAVVETRTDSLQGKQLIMVMQPIRKKS